jgi:2-polyprenyl-3-methyl-5-hydroxy-6-metoxy-1,4-benzoquinol methylase
MESRYPAGWNDIATDHTDMSDQTIEINISTRLWELALSVAGDLQRAIGLSEPWTSLRSYLNADSRVRYIESIENGFGVDLRKLRVLELGSGMGLFTTVARRLGVECFGSEPCAASYMNLRLASDELLSGNGLDPNLISKSPGEELPWPDASFDVVVAFQVLEHVASPRETLAEALRVLRPGGLLFMDMPNHRASSEGHFGLIWGPPLARSRRLAKLYVAWNGRNADFLNELNLITPRRLQKWTKPLAADFKISPPRPVCGPSVTTRGQRVVVRLPPDAGFGPANRFGPGAKILRRLSASRLGRAVLEPLGMSEHLWVSGRKAS